MPTTTPRDRPALGALALLTRRSPRYVPRHSTRETGPIWSLSTAAPAWTAPGATRAPDAAVTGEAVVEDAEVLLRSVLQALEAVDASAGRARSAAVDPD